MKSRLSAQPALHHPPSSIGAPSRPDALRSVQPKDWEHARTYPMSVVPEDGPRELALDTGSHPPQHVRIPKPRRLSRHSNGTVARASTKIGRPELDTPQAMLQTWLFVELNRKLGGKSVQGICSDDTCFTFWNTGHKEFAVVRWLRGVTLRRRYSRQKLSCSSTSTSTLNPRPLREHGRQGQLSDRDL